MKTPIGIVITDTHLNEGTLEVNFSVFQQAIVKCKALGLKHIFHAGDVFTSRKGQSEIVLNAFKYILDNLYENDVVLIAIAGNHDKQFYKSESSYIDAFAGHPALIVASPYLKISNNNNTIHFLPYFDEDLSYFPYLELIEPGAGKNILITHVAVNGVKNNGGIAVSNELTGDAFAKFDLVLVGHYHNRQKIGNIIYIGSTHQANFGEDAEKGCTILYDDATYEFEEFDTPQYVTVAVDDGKAININEIKKGVENGLKIRVKVGAIEDKLGYQLQALGVKVERVREDYVPADVVSAVSVQSSAGDILDTYEEWVKLRKIEDAEFGRRIIKKCLAA